MIPLRRPLGPHERLLRRSRWRVAILGALVVAGLLATLSTAAYLLARAALYNELSDRLEDAARDATLFPSASAGGGILFVDERGRPMARLSGTLHFESVAGRLDLASDTRVGPVAVLRLPAGSPWTYVATPAQSQEGALLEFLRALVGLTLVGALTALPAGYILAAKALLPLEEAVQERSGFVALASHQLRTPLSVIRTSAELALAGQGLGADEALRTILGQAARMEGLAARLTLLARSGADGPPAVPATDVAAVAADVVSGLVPAARQAGGELRLVAPAAVWVRAGPDELSDLLAAVVENAVAYGGGSAVVRIGQEGRHAVVEVADRGPGIAADDLPHVTEPFFQGRRVRGGHGLGLAIARSIAERRGGRLTVASEPGSGAVVRIVLPLAAAPAVQR